MDNVYCPKDLERLRRSTSKALSGADKPAGDPALIKKFNLIEFL